MNQSQNIRSIQWKGYCKSLWFSDVFDSSWKFDWFYNKKSLERRISMVWLKILYVKSVGIHQISAKLDIILYRVTYFRFEFDLGKTHGVSVCLSVVSSFLFLDLPTIRKYVFTFLKSSARELSGDISCWGDFVSKYPKKNTTQTHVAKLAILSRDISGYGTHGKGYILSMSSQLRQKYWPQ